VLPPHENSMLISSKGLWCCWGGREGKIRRKEGRKGEGEGGGGGGEGGREVGWGGRCVRENSLQWTVRRH